MLPSVQEASFVESYITAAYSCVTLSGETRMEQLHSVVVVMFLAILAAPTLRRSPATRACPDEGRRRRIPELPTNMMFSPQTRERVQTHGPSVIPMVGRAAFEQFPSALAAELAKQACFTGVSVVPFSLPQLTLFLVRL